MILTNRILPAVVAGLVVLGLSTGIHAYTMDEVIISDYAFIGDATPANDLALVVLDYDVATFGNEYALGVYFVDDNAVSGLDLLYELDADTSLVLNESGGFVNGISYAGHDGNYVWPDWLNYWLSTDGENWTESQVGAGDRIVHDGDWDGWAHAYGWPSQGPPQVPIPEPLTFTLLAPGAFAFVRRTRTY